MTTKLCLGLPWYDGPDEDVFGLHFELIEHLGRLRERSLWRQQLGHEAFMESLESVPPLDAMGADEGRMEPTEEDWRRLGVLEIGWADASRYSLPGAAREKVVDDALAWGADWILFFDNDMKIPHSAFLRLWRHQKSVVAALAFTARKPIHPVIFRFVEGFDEVQRMPNWKAERVLDYPRDQLITNRDVEGSLAFGGGVVLIKADVFRKMPKPWFSSTGCGEDIYFCMRLHQHGIPRYVDTSLKTAHKIHEPQWSTEEMYWKDREEQAELYLSAFEELQDVDQEAAG